jgi:chromosome segregation ATPase
MLTDAAPVVSLTQDPTFRAAVIGFVVALTTLAGAIGGWFMRQGKTKREAANQPGAEGRRDADSKLKHMEGEVRELTKGLADLSEKADDLARGVETAAANIRDLDDKVDEAAVQVGRLTTDMEWVKKALEAIGRKLGI